ncbi:hypothetical protein NPX13_g197 [Xylaria arbuscula]|uniref:Uncharacterized protein n=1 Tax=Xylaria arbuscula TaxID=114810 RepID=A0A9W8NNC9_9PEZI|nr:hypothetical protein NPX13_g197 [Xylaria arbuscula]
MLDALNLFQALTAELGKTGEDENAAIERAIMTYEKDMRKSAKEHAEDGIQMNDIMYRFDGAEKLIAFFKSFENEGQS